MTNMHINNYFFLRRLHTCQPIPSNVERFTQDWATFLIPNSETDPDKRKSYLPVIDRSSQRASGSCPLTGAKPCCITWFTQFRRKSQMKWKVIVQHQQTISTSVKRVMSQRLISNVLDPGDPNWQKFIIEVSWPKPWKKGILMDGRWFA